MPRGGPRNGAGRKPGRPNRRTQATIDQVVTEGLVTPLRYLLSVLNDEKTETDRRDRVAMTLLPFLHHRLTGAGCLPSPDFCSYRGDEEIEDSAMDYVERQLKQVKK